MKLKRLLSIVLCLALVIALSPAMSLTANAAVCSTHYVFITGGNVNIGDEITLRTSAYLQDLKNGSDYGVQNTYSYSVSDSSIAKINGNKLTFLKSGNVTLNIKHTQTFEKTNKTSTHTDTVAFTVAAAKPIQTTTIKLDSNNFVGGGTFPEFVVTSDSHCKVTNATFYKEMCDYYTGDKLPSYRSGTKIDNVTITLKPDTGYIFGFGGSNDNKFHENAVYTVEYKGKKYTPYVKHNIETNEMTVYLDVTFAEGAIYQTTIKDLEAPYHYGPLDKTATVESALQIVSIKYTMFNKELTSFAMGDNVGIAVRVKTKDNTNKIDPTGKAYWAEQKIYSSKTTKISDYEVEYGFSYRVEAGDAPQVETAYFQVPALTTGYSLPANAISTSPGVKVTKVTWTPADAVAVADKEYTVRIEFDKESNYVWASDFEDQSAASINGKFAEVKKSETQSGVGVKNTLISRYYVEAKMKPTTIVFTNTPGTTTTTTTEQNQTVVVGTITVTPTPGSETTEPSETEFSIAPEGELDVVVYEPTEKITFKVKCDYTGSESVDYQWYRCDANGKETGTPVIMIDTLTIDGIPNEEMMKTRYYKCNVCVGNTTKSLIFSAMLAPMGVEVDEYVFPFDDVKETDWFYDSVAGAHQMGLINGKKANIFAPNDNMTFAEAIKLAVCMNILKNGGNPSTDIANGTDVWYSTYMKYALDKKIIDKDYSSVANNKITRKEYVYIFSKAVPNSALTAINTIPTGSIPDVKNENTPEEKAIYLFYRAGILSGNDAKGTFNPSGNIKRSEVAAILIRMMDAPTRVDAPKDLGK